MFYTSSLCAFINRVIKFNFWIFNNNNVITYKKKIKMLYQLPIYLFIVAFQN